MKPNYFFIIRMGLIALVILVAVFAFSWGVIGKGRFGFFSSLILINPVAQAASPENGSKALEPAPDLVKAVYLTSWSGGRDSKINYVIGLAKTTEINAVVIDVKDFSGYVAYDSQVPLVLQYGAKQLKIPNISSVLQRLHKEGIYVIARIAVFQDPVLARNRTDLAIYKKESVSTILSLFAALTLWLDNLKLAWVDPSSKEVWDYNIAIAKEASDLGFDEINFDYVRFPSDGNLRTMGFPVWQGTVPKHEAIKGFFKSVREAMPDKKLSVDLFGLTTTNRDDLGVGQVIEDAYAYFDYVCPMVYPSHYAKGFLGFKNPAEYPYEVVKYSMEKAEARLVDYKKAYETADKKINVKLRPWLQDFNMGAAYDSVMVRAEIEATIKALGNDFEGFMLWNSSNFYTKEALKAEN